MSTKIYVNLPVRDLTASIDFFTEVGFAFDPQTTDDNTTCMVITDDIRVMLLAEPFFATFTKKELVDATKATEVIIALSVDSREQVDALVAKALAAGAQPANDPMDHGFMYGRSFADPDGHLWEAFHWDEATAPAQ